MKYFKQSVFKNVLMVLLILQIIVVGEVSTGKSAILRRYVHNFFSDRGDYRATLGVDFNLKLIHYNDELEIRLQLWDIAGQVQLNHFKYKYCRLQI